MPCAKLFLHCVDLTASHGADEVVRRKNADPVKHAQEDLEAEPRFLAERSRHEVVNLIRNRVDVPAPSRVVGV